ncbi:MAG: hypothetical protein KDK70_34815 [Myxococcales bacterium]|nr:hypothetical protein [Myxococcales bacterium]
MRTSLFVLISALTLSCRTSQPTSPDPAYGPKPQPLPTLRVPVTVKESSSTGGGDITPSTVDPGAAGRDPDAPSLPVDPGRAAGDPEPMQANGPQGVTSGSCPPVGRYGAVHEDADDTPQAQCQSAWSTCCTSLCEEHGRSLVDVFAVANDAVPEDGEFADLPALSPDTEPSTHVCGCACA